jgi:hypothetical protein
MTSRQSSAFNRPVGGGCMMEENWLPKTMPRVANLAEAPKILATIKRPAVRPFNPSRNFRRSNQPKNQ